MGIGVVFGGFSVVGVSGPLCRWEMGIGAVFGGLESLEGFFFSGGCLVYGVGGRWGLGWFLGVWEAWKGFFFSGGVWSTM